MMSFNLLIVSIIVFMFITVISIHLVTYIMKKTRPQMYKIIFDEFEGIIPYSPLRIWFPYFWEDDPKDNKTLKILKFIFKASFVILILSIIVLIWKYAK